MKRADFTRNAPGSLIKNLAGQLTFVPNPLPPKIEWTDALVNALGQTESALGRLAGLGQKFARPQRLTRLFLRREAELSSRIENTYAGVRTQLVFKLVPDVSAAAPDATEVDNNYRALEYGLEAIRSRRITVSLIKELHQILLRDVRGHDMTPGAFRKVQAHVGRSNDINEARFVPAPPHAVTDLMQQLAGFIERPSSVPRLARVAMTHYQFEAIHPFADGNGRIGRVLILLMMCEQNMLPLPLFNPSAQLERRRREYYDHLLGVSRRGDWGGWIEYFCEGVATECHETVTRIERLEQLRLSFHEKVRASRTSANIATLVDELFGEPVLTLTRAAQLLGVWGKSAQRLIDKLLALEILQEITGRQRDRVYVAQQVVDLFATRPGNG